MCEEWFGWYNFSIDIGKRGSVQLSLEASWVKKVEELFLKVLFVDERLKREISLERACCFRYFFVFWSCSNLWWTNILLHFSSTSFVMGSWKMIVVSEKLIFLVKLGFSCFCHLKSGIISILAHTYLCMRFRVEVMVWVKVSRSADGVLQWNNTQLVFSSFSAQSR